MRTTFYFVDNMYERAFIILLLLFLSFSRFRFPSYMMMLVVMSHEHARTFCSCIYRIRSSHTFGLNSVQYFSFRIKLCSRFVHLLSLLCFHRFELVWLRFRSVYGECASHSHYSSSHIVCCKVMWLVWFWLLWSEHRSFIRSFVRLRNDFFNLAEISVFALEL